MIQFLQEAAHVVPSKRQLDWYELESYAFIHFGVNTFTNRNGEREPSRNLFLILKIWTAISGWKRSRQQA